MDAHLEPNNNSRSCIPSRGVSSDSMKDATKASSNTGLCMKCFKTSLDNDVAQPQEISERVERMARHVGPLFDPFHAAAHNVATALVGHLIPTEEYVEKFVFLYFHGDWNLFQSIGAPYFGHCIQKEIQRSSLVRPELNAVERAIVNYFVHGIVPAVERPSFRKNDVQIF